jgi:hypothetical protein
MILAATAIATFGGVAALWSSRPAADQSTVPASFLDTHRNAHLDNLPVQDFDDLTFVFPRTAGR